MQTTPDVTVDGSAIDAPISTMPHFFPQIFYPYVFGAPAPYAPSDGMFGMELYYMLHYFIFIIIFRTFRRPELHDCL